MVLTSKTVEVGPVIIMGRDVSSMSFPALLRYSGLLLLAPVYLVFSLTRQPFKSRYLPALQRCPC
jgi:hypothetical protein